MLCPYVKLFLRKKSDGGGNLRGVDISVRGMSAGPGDADAVIVESNETARSSSAERLESMVDD